MLDDTATETLYVCVWQRKYQSPTLTTGVFSLHLATSKDISMHIKANSFQMTLCSTLP
jgi:hypothetical protein